MRLVLLALILVLVADAAEARRRVVYKIKRPPPAISKPVAAPATTQVRSIPIARWDLWCARIGGLECPQ